MSILIRLSVALALGATVSSILPGVHAQPAVAPAAAVMDHLILGAADLDAAIAWVEQRTGARAAVGGVHPGRGTRNALLSLGRRQYLEILAPDPSQGDAAPAHLRALTTPRMMGWAAASTDIDGLAQAIRAEGLQVFGPSDGSRARPDGKTLKWRALGVERPAGPGGIDPVPFFIQWAADSVHPSQDSPAGGELVALEFRHAAPDELRSLLRKMRIDAGSVTASKGTGITATLKTPKGQVVLE